MFLKGVKPDSSKLDRSSTQSCFTVTSEMLIDKLISEKHQIFQLVRSSKSVQFYLNIIDLFESNDACMLSTIS